MNSYLAKLVFNIRIDNGTDNKQFDEQTRLIQANTIEAAFFKARTLGKTLEDSFVNNENHLVEWKFIDVTELYALNDATDGEELYSTTHETENAGSFIKYVQDKSMLIQAKSLTFA
ncbi:MAG TPA: DUF4288 domain-containing protein [Bacteroidia bacterium]|jgi:hypothetical protein|nr:DUF4288 domain-containing protein [Bacteroidia bacterium]